MKQFSLPFISFVFEPRHDKTNKMSVRPAKTQNSLGIHPVWSESSLLAWRKLGSLATHWAHSEDSDQTGRMGFAQSDLSLCWAPSHFVGFVMSRLICCIFVQNLYFCLSGCLPYQSSMSVPMISRTCPQVWVFSATSARCMPTRTYLSTSLQSWAAVVVSQCYLFAATSWPTFLMSWGEYRDSACWTWALISSNVCHFLS